MLKAASLVRSQSHRAPPNDGTANPRTEPDGLMDFLDRFAATMPRTTLRYAVEVLDKAQRDHYMGLKEQA